MNLLTSMYGGVCAEKADDIPIACASGVRLPAYPPPCTATIAILRRPWYSPTLKKHRFDTGLR